MFFFVYADTNKKTFMFIKFLFVSIKYITKQIAMLSAETKKRPAE